MERRSGYMRNILKQPPEHAFNPYKPKAGGWVTLNLAIAKRKIYKRSVDKPASPPFFFDFEQKKKTAKWMPKHVKTEPVHLTHLEPEKKACESPDSSRKQSLQCALPPGSKEECEGNGGSNKETSKLGSSDDATLRLPLLVNQPDTDFRKMPNAKRKLERRRGLLEDMETIRRQKRMQSHDWLNLKTTSQLKGELEGYRSIAEQSADILVQAKKLSYQRVI